MPTPEKNKQRAQLISEFEALLREKHAMEIDYLEKNHKLECERYEERINKLEKELKDCSDGFEKISEDIQMLEETCNRVLPSLRRPWWQIWS